MELDVHLTREGGEPWGIEFVGGSDCHVPLTVDQIQQSSPAQAAALQPGDVVARLGDRLAAELTHGEALAIVAESVASLSLGICRGLYDPVLDDYEPIYEPIDQPDSDLRSEPTEVYPDLSLDDPNILDPAITDPSLWDSGYATRPLTETRSLTASPFVPNTKPYRPFSTEPLEVPPLDDPIILNPNYRDAFNLNGNANNLNAKALNLEEDDLVRLLPLDRNVEAKFKLPISEKFDPDWDKKVKALLEKAVAGERRDSQRIDHELASYSNTSETSTDVQAIKEVQEMQMTKTVTVQDNVFSKKERKEEIKFDEMKEFNEQKIEQVALGVVEESIERAVSVTEDIQKEIEEERASMARELQVEESETTSEMKIHIEELEVKEERIELDSKTERVETDQHETEILEESKHIVTEIEDIQEKLNQDQNFVEERRLSTKQVEEATETGNITRKSSVYKKHDADVTSHEENKHLTEESISAGSVKTQSVVYEKDDEPTQKEVLRKASQAEETKSEHQAREFSSSGIFSNETSKSESKQKAYMIGLQTIPHIKGFVQSSYHFDLLLRTFFVHLTDVMVALSRFILTQPAQELENKAEKVVREKLIKEFVEKDSRFEKKETEHRREEKRDCVSVQESKLQEKDVRQDKKVVQAKQEMKTAKVETQEQKEYKKETQEMQQVKHEAIKSVQVKSEDLVIKQKDIEIDSEDVEIRKKSGAEMAQRTQRKSRDLTKKMDAVITEFETKTGIEDRLEVTEQRSRRSRSRSQVEEEVMKESDPLEWLDKVDSKRTSQEITVISVNQEFSSYSESKKSKKSDSKHESRTITEKPGKQMYVAIVESHVYTNKDAILEDFVAEKSETASAQSSVEINAALESYEATSTENVAMSNMIQTEEKQQAVEVITNALQEVVQEKQEVQLETTKEVHVETKSSQQEAVSKQEILTTVAAESTEIIDESKLESFKAQEVISTQAVISSEENYKAAAESTEVILEATVEETAKVKVEEYKAVANVESLAIAVAQSTDVAVDDSKVVTFKTQELESEKALVKSEETFKTAAVGVARITFETAEEQHSERSQTSEVTIKQEAQHLAVAGIIETKTELCKEPKKPAQDEYASLKIVKEQIIDAGESVEISSESELNVKKSLDVEVDISSSLQSVSQSSYQAISQESSSVQETSTSLQETSISVQESHKSKSLRINTELAQSLTRQKSDQSDENNNTPTPVPPTPLTDEYVFKLEIPLPKNQGPVIIEDNPDREDPHIVKKGLIPYIETTIEEQIIYDPPLPTPPEDKVQSPVYTKPGLKGGAAPLFKKEYIREIERKSSLLASAIDETIKSIEEYKEEVGIDTKDFTVQLSKKMREEAVTNGVANGHAENGLENKENTKELSETAKTNGTDIESATESDAPPGFKPVVFNPEAYQAKLYEEVTRSTEPPPVVVRPYVTASGEPLGTDRGIVDGLDDATVDEQLAKELGKPGLTDDKIAELISGESEMLREAHVMGLTRVLTSHMTRPDDSVDFQKIKPLYDSLKDSEVLKALNEELKREAEKKKKDEKKWTTFLMKPKRPVPRAKFGTNGYTEPEEIDTNEPYKVKIVKQPKPKVAPDYKPEDFETGPLPWEQRALTEPVPSPVPPEEPILIPEEAEYFEAVDPLPESEVPDLEDTGIPLPPTPPPALPIEPPQEPQAPPDLPEPEPEPEVQVEAPPPPNMDQNTMAEQLVNTVKSMVDPHASLEQQLGQMRAQLAALAQLPCVIQQSLELLTQQLSAMSRQETHQASYKAEMNVESRQEIHENSVSIQEYEEQVTQDNQEVAQNQQEVVQNGHEGTQKEGNTVTIEEIQEVPTMTAEQTAAVKREQDAIIEEQRRSEKEKKERQEKVRFDQESRQVKQRAPRPGKPRPAFGPLAPEDRPLVLPGGRRWRGPQDAYNEQFIAETLQAQSEIIQGKVMGYESDRLPFDDRINFMKYEKPPVNLDHLQHSATYKLVHNIEEAPLKRTDLLTPVVAEADYRERCRSVTPVMQANGRM